MGKLDGKVALISGGARGQGAAEAETFAREGAKVVFGDIRDDEGKKVEAAIRAAGHAAVYLHLDVTSEADWQKAVQTAIDQFGKLDVLVNNAAIVIPRVPIEERTVAEWDQVMAVNAKGVFLGTKHAIPAMRRAGGGSIVNISSIAGIGQSLHQEPAYAASKGAMRIFTKVKEVVAATGVLKGKLAYLEAVGFQDVASRTPNPFIESGSIWTMKVVGTMTARS